MPEPSSKLIQQWSDAINDQDLKRVETLLAKNPELGTTPFFPRKKLQFYHSATYIPANFAAMTNDLGLMETLFKGGLTPTFGFAAESPEMTELVVRYGKQSDAFDPATISNELFTSSWFPNIDILRILLDAGGDPNARKSTSGIRPLMYVALRSDGDECLAITKLLIDRGADVNAKSYSGFGDERTRHDGYNHDVDQGHETPLHWAARRGKTDMARLLLEHGADPNTKTTSLRTDQHDDEGFYIFEPFDGETPKDWSYKSGNKETICLLCGDQALDNIASAARAGLHEHIQSLLESGADIHATDPDHGKSAIQWATDRKDSELCRILADAGAEWSDSPANAILLGVPSVVKSLVISDPSTKAQLLKDPESIFRDDLELNEFHQKSIRAVLEAKPESDLDLLLSGYISDKSSSESIIANRKDAIEKAVTAFPAIACYFVFDAGLLEQFLAAGADIEARGRPRVSTPLHRAIMTNQMDSVRVLLQHGANVEAERAGGRWRTLDIAACQHQKIDYRIIKLLLDAGADPNVEFHNGYTVLDILHDRERKRKLPDDQNAQVIEWIRAAGGKRAKELKLGK